MKIFELDNQFNVVCNTKDTKNGFKHIATLRKNGIEQYSTKVNYLNRTWECFTYETILLKMVDNYFDDNLKKKYIEVIKRKG